METLSQTQGKSRSDLGACERGSAPDAGPPPRPSTPTQLLRWGPQPSTRARSLAGPHYPAPLRLTARGDPTPLAVAQRLRASLRPQAPAGALCAAYRSAAALQEQNPRDEPYNGLIVARPCRCHERAQADSHDDRDDQRSSWDVLERTAAFQRDDRPGNQHEVDDQVDLQEPAAHQLQRTRTTIRTRTNLFNNRARPLVNRPFISPGPVNWSAGCMKTSKPGEPRFTGRDPLRVDGRLVFPTCASADGAIRRPRS